MIDERRLFLGAERSSGHALIMPELETFIADQLQKESAVLKERRKAREERELVRGLTPSGAWGTGIDKDKANEERGGHGGRRGQ